MGKLIENIRKFVKPDPSGHELSVSELGKESFTVEYKFLKEGIATRNITVVNIKADEGEYILQDEFISGSALCGLFLSPMGSKGTYNQDKLDSSVASRLIKIALQKSKS